ncbi:Ankyrin repeat domain-containing protein 6 [Amphibalanus amphitrite]|uniref:Ankyrin repeat domain-containing protein 6 n=1 Tax=Amphibalanus amphitrite TaxID=1232801 RepID=A0A6A4WFK7_AMPAM|nr:Ankyrin repeat domain-containing protein 6 [Amphibalanus amphitrite]
MPSVCNLVGHCTGTARLPVFGITARPAGRHALMASPVPAAGAAARPREERLRLAASLGHTEQVEALIAAGTPVTADVEGRTALHLACAGGHAEVVAALLSAGCDANCPEKAGRPSPVEMAGPDRLNPGRRGYLPDADSDVSTVTFEREVLQRKWLVRRAVR